MPNVSNTRLVGPQHQQLEQIRGRRDEAVRLHAPRIRRDEFLLERLRVFGRRSRDAPTRTSRRRSTAPMTSPPMTSPASCGTRGSRKRTRRAPAATISGSHKRTAAPTPAAMASAGRSDVGAPTSQRTVSSPFARQGANTPFSVMYAEAARNTMTIRRLEVAGAGADQRLAAAAGGERHAEAEQEAADEVRQPRHLRAGVDRLGGVDQARPPAAAPCPRSRRRSRAATSASAASRRNSRCR